MSDSTDDSDLDIAQPEDFFVERDSEDNLQPVTQKLPGVEQHIRIIPMTLGDVNKYGLDDGNVADSDLAEICNKHLADLERELSAEDISENMIGFGKDALVQAILRASGYDMQSAINREQFEMIADMDEGKFERVMQMAERQQ